MRPEHIPLVVWNIACRSGQCNGAHEQTIKTAEMLMRRIRGEQEDQVSKQVFAEWLNQIVLGSIKGE